MDAEFQGLQDGGLGVVFGDGEKSKIGGAAMASTASFPASWRCKEGGRWLGEGEMEEARLMVCLRSAGDAGLNR